MRLATATASSPTAHHNEKESGCAPLGLELTCLCSTAGHDVERVDVSSDAVALLEQNSTGANLVDGSSAVGLDHELAVAECAHHPGGRRGR